MRFRALLLLHPDSTALLLSRLRQTGRSHHSGNTTIAVIPKGTTHEFWKSIHAGAVKASRELNVEIIWKGPSARG